MTEAQMYYYGVSYPGSRVNSYYRQAQLQKIQNEMYHHGIRGQKWGVRRYQNLDGSYTAAGKERYNTAQARYRSGEISKKELKAEKKAFKTAVRMDRGKELVNAGESTVGIAVKTILKDIGIGIGTKALMMALAAPAAAASAPIASILGLAAYSAGVSGTVFAVKNLVNGILDGIATNTYTSQKIAGNA